MDQTPRRSNGKREHLHDYIADARVLSAVSFARKMIRNGEPPGLSIWRAADYYRVSMKEVAHFVGQVGGTSRGRRKR